MIEDFLNKFYETISFEHDESFKEAQFAELFLDNAVLLEKDGPLYKKKTINEHINEFKYTINNYPELFLYGFKEKQISFTLTENEECILVSSCYQKYYSRNNEVVEEQGINNMIITKLNNKFKIACVLW